MICLFGLKLYAVMNLVCNGSKAALLVVRLA